MSEHDGAAAQHADAEEAKPGLLQEPLVREGKRDRFAPCVGSLVYYYYYYYYYYYCYCYYYYYDYYYSWSAFGNI